MKEKENSEKTEQNKTEITIKKKLLLSFRKNLKKPQSILNKKKYIKKNAL